MGEILFVCTGNYYRSRFAEIYFNNQTKKNNIKGWVAFSRGFRINSLNKGLISPYALVQLSLLQIPLPENLDAPKSLSIADLHYADQVVALDEEEHRPLVREQLPGCDNKFTYWQIRDIQFEEPGSALNKLKDRVDDLIAFIRESEK